MLQIYSAGQQRVTAIDCAGATLPPGAVWLDLLNPTKEEEAFVERAVGAAIPTRDEAVEIEPSSRQYREGDAIVVIASIVAGVDDDAPMTTPVSFVLTPRHLVTIRYAEPKVFKVFGAHVERSPDLCSDATMTLIHLLDAIVDRMADVLEGIGTEMDNISRSTFRRGASKKQRMTNAALAVLLVRIGHAHDVVAKSRVSGVSVARLLSFLGTHARSQGDEGASRRAGQGCRRADRPRQLPQRQHHLPARCRARPDQHRAECRAEDLHGRGDGADAADPDRRHLRHELQDHCPSCSGTYGYAYALGADAAVGGAARMRGSARKGWM